MGPTFFRSICGGTFLSLPRLLGSTRERNVPHSQTRDRQECLSRQQRPCFTILTLVVLTVALSGCKKDDMAVQPKQRTYEPSPVFADGTEARPLVAGTVARPPRDTPGTPYAYQWAPGRSGRPTQWETTRRSPCRSIAN